MNRVLVVFVCLLFACPIYAHKSYYESVGQDRYSALIIDWEQDGFVYMGYNPDPDSGTRNGYLEMFGTVKHPVGYGPDGARLVLLGALPILQ